ncbi:MAG: hypothetical protein ABR992_15140, partial [Solirubrobacteraceae bacterium]
MPTQTLQTSTTSYPMHRQSSAYAANRAGAHSRHAGELMRCVSSGYLSDGCSCQATIPSTVVTTAWAREQELLGSHEDRFFRFAWRGGVWFAFGVGDGSVRGVYCPTHSAARAERS